MRYLLALVLFAGHCGAVGQCYQPDAEVYYCAEDGGGDA